MTGKSGRNGKQKPKHLRCAIYTRVSTPDQANGDFTSIDNQREACEAYIKSQQHEGWTCLEGRFDDAGFSGGTLDRPALSQLLAEVETGRVDAVVVYKVDRLSRSLLDFARLVEVFDRRGVSFVSVTQPINTADSTGRLMLNILLSFAQFERETIADRTRDKMSAARRRGKWTGGQPMLGFDLHPDGGRLVVNEAEAAQVREIFALYLEKQSLHAVNQELRRRDWLTKAWTTRTGQPRGGRRFTKEAVHRLLTNPVYLGQVRHRGEVYEGEHPAIVQPKVFRQAQKILARNRQHGGTRVRNRYGFLLRGLVRCTACGTTYGPRTTRKGAKVYRYYVCTGAQRDGYKTCPCPSLGAQRLEEAVVDQIRRIGQDPALVRATVGQVKRAKKARLPALRAEQKRLRGELEKARGEIRRWLEAFDRGSAGAEISRHIGLLEGTVRRLEGRLTELEAEIAAVSEATVDQADVAQALGLFDPIWEVLYLLEQERIIQLLVERIDYGGESGNLEIEFRATGITALAAEVAEPEGNMA